MNVTPRHYTNIRTNSYGRVRTNAGWVVREDDEPPWQGPWYSDYAKAEAFAMAFNESEAVPHA